MRKLSRTDRDRILEAIARLPFGDTKRLQGGRNIWRLRVGEWRVRFERDQKQHLIDVLAVDPRGSAYKP